MKTKQRISCWQIVLALFLSRMFVIVTDTPIYKQHLEPTALIIGNIASIALSFFLLLPAFLLFHKKDSEHDFLRMSSQTSPFIGKVIGWIFLAGMLLGALSTLVHLHFFMLNTTFASIKTPMVLILVFLCGLYAAHLGIEGLVRASSILFFFVVASLLLVVIAANDIMDFTEIRPLMQQPFVSVMRSIWEDASQSSELAVLLLLFTHVKGSFRRTASKFVLLSGLFLVFITSVTTVIMGSYMYEKTFPFYTVVSVFDVGSIRRIEAIYMMLFTMMGLVRFALYLIVVKKLIQWLVPFKAGKWGYATVSLAIFFTALILSNSIDQIQFVYVALESRWVYLVLVFLLPLVVALLQLFQSKFKSRTKNNPSSNPQEGSVPTTLRS